MKYLTLLFLIVSTSACASVNKDVQANLKPIVDIDYVLIQPKEKTTCVSIDLDKKANKMRKLDNFKNSWQVVSLCEVDKNETSTALAIFYYMWEKEFGDPGNVVSNNLNEILIKWGEKYKAVPVAYSTNGIRKEGVKAKGMTLTKNYIWIKRNQQGDLHKTSLIHELVHASLWASTGSADADHEATTYKNENFWTPKHTAFIEKVNKILSSLDI